MILNNTESAVRALTDIQPGDKLQGITGTPYQVVDVLPNSFSYRRDTGKFDLGNMELKWATRYPWAAGLARVRAKPLDPLAQFEAYVRSTDAINKHILFEPSELESWFKFGECVCAGDWRDYGFTSVRVTGIRMEDDRYYGHAVFQATFVELGESVTDSFTISIGDHRQIRFTRALSSATLESK